MTLETSTLRRAGLGFLVFAALICLPNHRSPQPSFQGRPLGFWLGQLGQSSTLRTPETADALVALGKATLPALRSSLTQRTGMLFALRTRLHAVVPAWASHPTDPEDPRRLAVAIAERLGPQAQWLIPELAQAFRLTRHPTTRDAIGRLLARLGDDGIATLGVLTLDPDALCAEQAIRSLGEGPAGHHPLHQAPEFFVALLANRLTSAETTLVLTATHGLSRLGPQAHPAMPLLRENLSHASPAIRAASAEALGRLSPPHPSCLKPLVAGLDDASIEVRLAATAALGGYGPLAAEAIPRLLIAVEREPTAAALAAIQTLGKMGPKAGAAAPPLCRLLEAPTTPSVVKAAAAVGLGRIGASTPTSVRACARALEHPDEYVRQGAAKALRTFGPAAAPALSSLVQALFDPVETVRVQAAEALGSIGPAAHSAIPSLQAARNNNQSVMTPPVIAALANIQRTDPLR